MTTTVYRDHALRTSVKRMLELLSGPDFSSDVVASNEAFSFARDKAFAIAKTLNDLLEQTPAELASVHGLNQLNNNIQPPLTELTAYVGNKNPEHIRNAANQLEQSVLSLFWTFAPQVQQTAEQTFPALLQAQAQSAREVISQLHVRRDELTKQLVELQSQAKTLSEKLDETATAAAKERAEAAATVAKLEQAFTERETERQSKFEATLGEFRNSFSTQSGETKSQSDQLLSALEEQKDKAARIVQVVGNIGVTGNYQRIANNESEQANLWRWITIGIFGGGIAVAAATFYKFWGQPLTTETGLSVLIRLLYAVALTAPAWYTARESARHRTNADRARQTELELASIGPFIELLPEAKKNDIRERLTPVYFGRNVDPHVIHHPLDPALIKDTVVEAVKAVKP